MKESMSSNLYVYISLQDTGLLLEWKGFGRRFQLGIGQIGNVGHSIELLRRCVRFCPSSDIFLAMG